MYIVGKQSMNAIPKQHFHSLEALRFFAFLKVYLLHVPLQGSFPIFEYLKGGGGIGVSFFFVLSGFLITYLLAYEKIHTGNINVKRFMIRRSLRIWPLYYGFVILVFILPYDFKSLIGFHMVGGGYDLDWRFSFTFLENYKMLLLDNWPKTTPLSVFWSLCIEEQFYLAWVLVFSVISASKIKKFLLFSFVIAWVARWVEPFIFPNHTIIDNDLFTNLDYFASGGLLGYWVAKDYHLVERVINAIDYWKKMLFLWGVVLMVVFQKELLPYEPNTLFFIVRPTIIAILFTGCIAVFIPQDSSIRIKSSVLHYLGKISYGLYVYHIVFIHVVFQFFIYKNIAIDNWQTLLLFMLITLGGSIVVSSLSYYYFEKRFLAWREVLT